MFPVADFRVRYRLPPREALVGDFEMEQICSMFRRLFKVEVNPTDIKPDLSDGKNSMFFNVAKDTVCLRILICQHW